MCRRCTVIPGFMDCSVTLPRVQGYIFEAQMSRRHRNNGRGGFWSLMVAYGSDSMAQW